MRASRLAKDAVAYPINSELPLLSGEAWASSSTCRPCISCGWRSKTKLAILNQGMARKFVSQVEHVTFSGAVAASRGQKVLYVTERCVFVLTPDGLELSEVAPGVDIERHILSQMDFKPDRSR